MHGKFEAREYKDIAQVVIRPATTADAEAIRECADQAFARYVPAIGRKPAPMIADFNALIAANKVYVAPNLAGIAMGFAVFYPRSDHMFLENVAVYPSLSGQGIGRSLIEFCENEARRIGLVTVELYTNEKMTENLLLYPRLGYTETDRRSEDGFRRVYFQKLLA